MSRVATLLLVAAAAAAAVFLFFIEPHMQSTREVEQSGGKLYHLDPGSIRELAVRNGDQVFEFKRRGDSWQMGPAPKDRADPSAVAQLLNLVQNLRILDVVRARELKGDLDLKDYGLKEPKSQLDIGGNGALRLLFGKEAIGEGRIYVRKADSNDVYTVSDDLQRYVSRSPQEFRDRRLTDLDPEQVESFVIKRGSGEIEVRHAAKGWEIVKPLKAAADSGKVENFLGPLLGMRILEFVSDDREVATHGLAEPQAQLTINTENQKRPQVLRVGSKTLAGETDAVMAQFTARDSIYKLPADALSRLQSTPDDFRDRNLLSLNLDIVDRITIQRGNDKIELARGENDWEMGTGEGKMLLDSATVRVPVESLCAVQVEEFIPGTSENLARAGLDHPTGNISFDAWLSENTPEAPAGRQRVAGVVFGKVEGACIYARTDENGDILRVAQSAATKLPAAIHDWQRIQAAARSSTNAERR